MSSRYILGDNSHSNKPVIHTGDNSDLIRIANEVDVKTKGNKENKKDNVSTPSLGKQQLGQQDCDDYNIESYSDFWRISGVEYLGKTRTYDLKKSLLEKGASKTQEEWATDYCIQKSQNGFYTADMPLHHSVFTALFNQKDNPESKKASDFIQWGMVMQNLMTLTRIIYSPSGIDTLIHNYGTSDKYELFEVINGDSGFIDCVNKKTLNALLGSRDLDKISMVYYTINPGPCSIIRFNSKKNKIKKESIAFFRSNSQLNYFCCENDSSISLSSLGFREVL